MNEILSTINLVPGLDIKAMLVKSDNLVDGTENFYLPVKAQKEWFRLKCPDGKIELEMTHVDRISCIARCRIYADKRDPNGAYLSENYATRFNAPGNNANYCDWACTMAIGRALEDAGFGLQMDLKSEASMENQVIPPPSKMPEEVPVPFEDPSVPAPIDPPSPEPMPDPSYEGFPKTPGQALSMVCPIGTHRGKTFSELIALKEDVGGLADWILKERKRTDSRITPQLKAAAEIIKRVVANPEIDLDQEI